MRHVAGLSDGFWEHAVGTAVHIYNVTDIKSRVPHTERNVERF